MKRCLNCMETMPDELTVCPHCGYDEETTEDRLDQLKPGCLLKERFTIGRPLGRGGFGITYIAWDNSLQRKVAIKEYMPRGMALRDNGNTTISYDPETKEDFLRGVEKTLEESRKLAGFTDLESVVNVYDCFKENGTAYIVMEVLKGENVKEKLKKQGNLSFEETIKIITPVLKALAAVHKAGLIHRDISPDNIFICNSGKIKLLDFGSARIADSSDERSRSIVLKHGYAPKEQYTSKGRQGAYTDIYAVSATIYKMLTGITPVDSIERIADEDELQDISELVKIPSAAAKAIMKGMAVNAADRIQSADELLEMLNTPDELKSPYDDAEETVTLYVPSSAVPDNLDEPVAANEIKASGSLAKLVNDAREKSAADGIAAESVAAAGAALSVPVKAADASSAIGTAKKGTEATVKKAAKNSDNKPEKKSPQQQERKPQKTEPAKRVETNTVSSSSGKGKKSALIAGIAVAAIAVIAAGAVLIPKITKKNVDAPQSETKTYSYSEKIIAPTLNDIMTTTAKVIESVTEQTKTTSATNKETTAKTAIDLSKLTTAYIKTQDNNSKVNLRESPSTDSKSFATLASGTEVKLITKEGDWYKVIVNGKTGYIKADYITDKKPVAFTTGYVKDRIYYNEWANLKFVIPNDFVEDDSVYSGDKNTEGFSGGLALRTEQEDEFILIRYYKSDISTLCQSKGFAVSDLKSTVLGGQEYKVFENSEPHMLYTDYKRFYMKKLDDYVVYIYFEAISQSRLDEFALLFSIIS